MDETASQWPRHRFRADMAIGPAHGLIGTFAEARKCVKYISRADVGAEPELWLPWLIIDHPGSMREVT